MEPQIKAKLILDTSELSKAGIGTGGGSSKSSGVIGESTKLLRTIAKGQSPISNLSSLILTGAVGAGGFFPALGAAVAAASVVTLSSFMEKDKTIEKGKANAEKQKLEFGKYESKIQDASDLYSDELEKKRIALLEAGDVEGAEKIAEEQKRVLKNTIALTEGSKKVFDFMTLSGDNWDKVNVKTGEDEGGLLWFLKSINLIAQRLTGGSEEWDKNLNAINESLVKYKKSIPKHYTSSYKIERMGSDFDPYKEDQKKDSVFIRNDSSRKPIRANYLDNTGVN